MANNDYLEALLEESIRAQNRTTYAVRAVAHMLRLTTLAVFLGFVAFVFGSSIGPISAVAAVVIMLVSIWLSGSQLAKSVVPRTILSTTTVASVKVRENGLENQTSTAGLNQLVRDKFKLEWSDDDEVNAKHWLNNKQYEAWSSAGKPALAGWVIEGSHKFELWLQDRAH